MLAKFNQTIDEFTIVQKLYQGLNVSIYLASYKNTLTIIKKFPKSFFLSAYKEYTLAKYIKHENILKNFGLRKLALHINAQGLQETCTIIIMEYMAHGELFKYVQKAKGFPESVVRTIFHMLIQGLSAIHQKGIAHLDIKLQNILFDRSFNLKIADFGFATQDSYIQNTSLGTEGYMAPQIAEAKVANCMSADIFSTGVVLFMMSTALKPFQSSYPSDHYYSLLCNSQGRYWKALSKYNLSDSLKNLIEQMLHKDANKRPNIQKIKNHEWYKGETISKSKFYKYMKTLSDIL